jgi:hypothetical protein
MNKEFFQKIIPSQGYVCVASLKGQVINRFTDSADKAMNLIQSFMDQDTDVHFSPGTFEGMRRKKEDCTWVKSFFLDLDVEHGNCYPSRDAALSDLERFRQSIGWPEPVLVDSGGGIHAYWIFNDEIPADEWVVHATKFKALLLAHNMIIDEDVPAMPSHMMRVPGSVNYRYDPPRTSTFLTDIYTYDFDLLAPALDSAPQQFDLARVEKGLDPDTQAIYDKRRGNFEYDFGKIAEASLGGSGCEQIKWIIENAASCPEPLWYAGLSVAVRCRDGSDAIHKLSEDHPNYTREETEQKAAQSLREATWAHGCDAFRKENSERCAGCSYAGRIAGPIEIGRIVKVDAAAEQREDAKEPVRDTKNPEKVLVFPDFLHPYQRGINGGIYYVPPPRRDKKGKVIQDDPELLTPNDVYPIKRVYSPHDGECLVMKLFLPLDKAREFLLPLKDVAALDRLRSVLASNGVVFDLPNAPRLANYLMRWSAYLIETQKAEIMRIQQGWTEDCASFVIGTTEITPNAELYCPPSPMAKNVVNNLFQFGSYEKWKRAAQMFNDPGYELHAFTMLCGFASPLMELTNVNGVTLSLYGNDPGSGKTGALNGAVSVWGKPQTLAIFDSTPNALISRMITSKNIPFALDEQGNLEPKTVSSLIYNISSGMPKLRMMSSANQERELAFMTKLIAIITTNYSLRTLLYEHRANATAENVRILEPVFVRPTTPGYELTQERGLEMFEPFKTNFGHAGPDYIRCLYEIGLDEVRRRVTEEYLKVANKYSRSSEYRFLSNLISVTRVAGQICNARQILDFDLERIFRVVGSEFDGVIAGKKNEDDTGHLDIIGDFINDNIQNCLVVRDGRVTTEPRHALHIRAEVDNGYIYISTSAMKNYLKEMRVDIRNFEAKLKASGVMRAKVKKQMATGWKDAFGSTNVNAYELKLSITHLFDGQQASTT